MLNILTPRNGNGRPDTGALSETLLSSTGTGGMIWGLLRGDVTRLADDMRAVKKAMGLEPSNGKIEAAFIPRGECRLMEDASASAWTGARGGWGTANSAWGQLNGK